MDEEKTEQPTPRSRQRARERGQVAKSKELTGTFVLLFGILTIFLIINYWKALATGMFRDVLGNLSSPAINGDSVPMITLYVIKIVFSFMWPGITTPVEYLDRSWFAIRSVNGPEEAETLREFLESKDIDVAIRNAKSNTRGLIKMNSGMGSNMLVLVPAESASHAANLVRNNDWTVSSSVDDLVRSVYPDEDDFSDEIDLLDDESEYIDAALAVDACDDYDDM